MLSSVEIMASLALWMMSVLWLRAKRRPLRRAARRDRACPLARPSANARGLQLRTRGKGRNVIGCLMVTARGMRAHLQLKRGRKTGLEP